jgi:hypothetical protein
MQAAQTGTATPFRGFQQFHEQANELRDPMDVVLKAIDLLPSPEDMMQANKLAQAEMIDPTQAAGAKVRATGQAAAMNAAAVGRAAQMAASGFGRGFGNLAANRRQAAALAAQGAGEADDRAYAEGEWDRQLAAREAKDIAAEERKAQAEAAKQAEAQKKLDKKYKNYSEVLRRGHVSPEKGAEMLEEMYRDGYDHSGNRITDADPSLLGLPGAPVPPDGATPTIPAEPLGPETAIAGPPPGMMQGIDDEIGDAVDMADAEEFVQPTSDSPDWLRRYTEGEGAEDAARHESKMVTGLEDAAVAIEDAISALEVIDNAESPISGPAAELLANVNPSSSAGQLRSYIGSLTSKVAIGAMLALKEASKTGATGFGQLNKAELDLLIASMGPLDPFKTDPKILRKTVTRILNRWERVKKSILADPQMTPEVAAKYGLEGVLYSPSGSYGPPQRGMELDSQWELD